MFVLNIDITPYDIVTKKRGTSKDKITSPFICETDPVALALSRTGLRDVVCTGLAFWHTYKETKYLVDLPKPLRDICDAYDLDQFQNIKFGSYRIDLNKMYEYTEN